MTTPPQPSPQPFLYRCLISVLLLSTHLALVPPAAAIERMIPVDDENEVPVEVYGANGDRLLLWLPSEHGLRDGHRRIAAGLADAGIETWLADPFTGFYLPNIPGSLDALPSGALAALLDAAASSGKTVYLLSHDRGVVPALRGLHEWQMKHPQGTSIGGVVLISPNPSLSTDAATATAEPHPIMRSTNAPIYLIQPTLSPGHPRLGDMTRALQQGGSDVFLHPLPRVRDRFFFRMAAFEQERLMAERLPIVIHNGLRLLATQDPRRTAPPLAGTAAKKGVRSPEVRLVALTDRPDHPPLALQDTGGRLHRIEDYRGQVVLVNFWASWCPPCVHEMPSMQQLTERHRDQGLAILAVNIGEERHTVASFMQDLNLTFPALLDTRIGALAAWQVFVYPTSFLLDREGRMRFVLHGAIDWQQRDVLASIEALLGETTDQSSTEIAAPRPTPRH